MPFAPAANPDLAGQFMFQGIAQAGEGIAQGASALIEGLQKKTKDRKAYLGLGEAMVRSGELTPEQWEAAKNTDTDTLTGLLDGQKAATVLKQLKLQNQLSAGQVQLNQQQLDALNFEMQQRRKSAAGQSQFGEWLGARTAPPQGPTISGEELPRAPIDPREVYGRAAQAGLPFTMHDVTEMDQAFERYGRPAPVMPPGFVPQSTTIGAEGRQSVTYGLPDTAKAVANKYPWLLSDDMEEFKQGLRALDPVQRDAAIAARSHYEQAMGRPSVLERLLIGDKAGAPANTPATTKTPPKTETKPQPKVAGKVRMMWPNDGTPDANQIGWVPEAQVKDALKLGYRRMD